MDFRHKNLFKWILFLIVILTAAWITLFNIPLPRQIGLTFRYDLGSTAVLILASALICLLIKGIWSQFAFTAFFIFISIMPLSGVWASGQTEPYSLFGLIPYSDARSYYLNAERFLMGDLIFGISSYRPITTAFLSVLLRLTNANLQAAIAIQTLLVACCIIVVVLYIRDTWGALTASFFTLLSFFFWRPFIGTVMTENLGFAFGLCGFMFLLAWSRSKKSSHLFLGTFILSTGLNIRAGAYFILPGILLILLLFRKAIPKKQILIFITGFFLAWIFNILISIIYSGKIISFSSNVMDNLYQLVTNSDSWRELRTVYPNIDTSKTGNTLKIIFTEFFKNPLNLVKSVSKAYAEYFALGRPGAFGFLEGERVHSTRFSLLLATIGLYLLSAAGIISEGSNWLRKKDLTSVLLLTSILGIILSAPILYCGNYSGMRFFAATMGFQILLPCLGFRAILSLAHNLIKHPMKAPQVISEIQGSSIVLVLLFSVLISLLLNTIFRKPLQLGEISCGNNEIPVQMTINQGSYVSIVPNDFTGDEYLPNIRETRARLSSHGLSTSFSSEFETLSAPFLISTGINAYTMDGVFLVLAPEELPQPSNEITLCTQKSGLTRLDKNGFLFSNKALANAFQTGDSQ